MLNDWSNIFSYVFARFIRVNPCYLHFNCISFIEHSWTTLFWQRNRPFNHDTSCIVALFLQEFDEIAAMATELAEAECGARSSLFLPKMTMDRYGQCLHANSCSSTSSALLKTTTLIYKWIQMVLLRQSWLPWLSTLESGETPNKTGRNAPHLTGCVIHP